VGLHVRGLCRPQHDRVPLHVAGQATVIPSDMGALRRSGPCGASY
jgi:hypothetical protein